MSFRTYRELLNARQRLGIVELERTGMKRKEIAFAVGEDKNMIDQVMSASAACLGPDAHLKLIVLCLSRACFGIVLVELPANWALYRVDPGTIDGCLDWERREVLEGLGIGSARLEDRDPITALPHLIRAHTATGSAVGEALHLIGYNVHPAGGHPSLKAA